jgi:succinate dehydrogenase/fumarate reductase cytochrome b subunit
LFAVSCELLAVGSFTIVWGACFYAAFPFVARQMLSSPAVLILIGSILTGLTCFVVFIHALWGVGLEWGIARGGGQADMNRGIRFGLYACGWDLLTSPAGVWFQWRRAGFRQGLSHLRSATKAPRASLRAYLDDCRETNDRQKKSAMWTSILLGISGIGLAGLLLFCGLLVAWLPWIF